MRAALRRGAAAAASPACGAAAARQGRWFRPTVALLKEAQAQAKVGKVQAFLTPKRIIATYDCGEITVVNDSNIFAWIVMDSKAGSANSLSEAYIESTKKALDKVDELIDAGQAKVVVLTSNKDTFCVGADLPTVYPLLPTEEDRARLDKIFDDGKELTDRLKGMSVPLIAAINGMALGGGLEIALVCHHRVVSDADSCKVGLPETMLGVIPGLGGTVRLQKLIGVQRATPMILQGQQIKGAKAKKLGLCQECFPGVDRIPNEHRFLSLVRNFAGKKVDTKVRPHKGKPVAGGFPASYIDKLLNGSPFARDRLLKKKAKQTLDKLTKGKYLGQYRALESILYAASNGEEKALAREREIFTQCLFTPEAKNQMSIYFLDEQSKKLDKKLGLKKGAVTTPTTAAVIGAGVMGSGIAHWFTVRGLQVYMRDIKQEFVDKGMTFVNKEFDTQLKKKKITADKHAKLKASITAGTEEDGLKNCEVLVEAAVEVMDLKKKMIQELEASGVLDGKRIFATNTSSLSLNEMQSVSKYPQNIVGMHFFNPVAKMPLVEIITGDKTSKEAVAAIYQLTLKIGKKPIIVKDGPGFLVNRVLGIYMAEAGRMLAQRADPQKIDKLVTGFGMPMGPFRLLDEVGFDVAAHVGPVLQEGLKSKRFSVDDEGGAVTGLYKKGWLGKKNKKGFYNYDEKDKEKGFNSSIMSTIGQTSDPSFRYDDCCDRLFTLMINEACFIMEEGLVDGPETVDLGMIFGTGFAPFRGGLCQWADHEGAANLVQRMERLRDKYGDHFTPAQTLQDQAANGTRFFPGRPFLKYKERVGCPNI